MDKITEFFKEVDEIIINNDREQTLKLLEKLLTTYTSKTERNILNEWIKILKKVDKEEFQEIQKFLSKAKTDPKTTVSEKEIEILQNLITAIGKFSELNNMFKNLSLNTHRKLYTDYTVRIINI